MPQPVIARPAQGGLRVATIAGFAVSAAFGGVLGAWLMLSRVSARPTVSPDAFTVVTHDQKQATQKLAAELASLKQSLETMAGAGSRPRSPDETRALRTQIDRLDRQIERTRLELSGNVAPLLGRFEQLDRQQRDTAANLAKAMERLEQIERQNLVTGSINR